MNVFNKFKTPDYSKKIMEYNPFNPTPEHEELLQNYKTPSTEYISKSARALDKDQVKLDTLEYLIERCYQCTEDERHQACIVTLYRFSLEASVDLVNEAKTELADILQSKVTKRTFDTSFLKDVTQGYSKSFFYLLKIEIGVNTIFKYGITKNDIRARLAQIKSDVDNKTPRNNSAYIEPILLIHMDEVEELEEEVKAALQMNNIITSGYKFSGHTETFKNSDYDTAIELIKSSVKTFNHQILHTSTDLQKSFSNPSKRPQEREISCTTNSSSIARTDGKDGVILTTFPS
jgi:hypothetical protein